MNRAAAPGTAARGANFLGHRIYVILQRKDSSHGSCLAVKGCRRLEFHKESSAASESPSTSNDTAAASLPSFWPRKT
eukprot:s671_g4.t1